ncbi:M14 family metallopeptidase [Dryocola clanedunensis]|jgi:predicted deacylase
MIKKQHIWPLKSMNSQSNDIALLQQLLKEESMRWGFKEVSLGQNDDAKITLLQAKGNDHTLPHALIASGFHGEEPAGPWGILDFLQNNSPQLLDTIALSFLPVVNFSGTSLGQRLNLAGENPNRGFTPGKELPSSEGKILLKNQKLIFLSARDGVLCCHEDLPATQSYVYTFEAGALPGDFSLKLRDSLAVFFSTHPDGEVDGCQCRDGIIYNQRDSSFESWLVSLGVPVAATTETPGTKCFEQRIAANSAVIGEFVSAILARHSQ